MKKNPKNPKSLPQSKSTKDDLSEQELDKVTGGTGKAAADEGPKEEITFVYGGLSTKY
jgi:hypothetical protein